MNAIENLTLERLLKDAKQFNTDQGDSYIQSYPVFINYFKEIDEIEKDHLVISSHFVYGWMPTIIHLNLNKIDKVLELLNDVKSGYRIDESETIILKECINNSLVGLSKLLHFINPEDYAIWDSRIFRYITLKKSTYGIDKPGNYLAYLRKLKSIGSQESYDNLHSMITIHFNYPVTPMRVMEVSMFEADKRMQSANHSLIVSNN